MPVLPPLNEGNIKLWLTQVEMMAHDVGLVDDKATFYAVASRLPERAANAAADILQDVNQHSWALLRQRLEKDFSKSSHQAMHDFLSNTKREKGERPTAFLRRLRIASENKATDPILLSFVLASLPTSLQQTLRAARVQTAPDAAEAADEALFNEPSSTVAAVSAPATATSAIDAKLDKLTALMEKFFSSGSVSAVSGQQRQSRQRSRANSEERPSSKREDTPGRPRSRSRSLCVVNGKKPESKKTRSDSKAPGLCWYHRRWGADAKKCSDPPCSWWDGHRPKPKDKPKMAEKAEKPGNE